MSVASKQAPDLSRGGWPATRGYRRGACPGPVIIRAVLMALAVPRTRLGPLVSDPSPRQRLWQAGRYLSGGAIVRPDVTDTRLAEARECFLTGEPIGPGRVRDTILASWRRSQEWNVAARHIDLLHAAIPTWTPR